MKVVSDIRSGLSAGAAIIGRPVAGRQRSGLVAHQLVDDQPKELVRFAALVQPAKMFAAIGAARYLPGVALEPGVLAGGGAADVAARRERKAAGEELSALWIDEAVLMLPFNLQLGALCGDGRMAKAAQNQFPIRHRGMVLQGWQQLLKWVGYGIVHGANDTTFSCFA